MTDRTPEDVLALKGLLSRPMGEWTAEELEGFLSASHRGAYNYTDLNRVTAAMEHLHRRLTDLGYATGYIPAEPSPGRRAWQAEDIPTASQLEGYLQNVKRLRAVLALPSGVPPAPQDMDRLTVQEANAIEVILSHMEAVINSLSAVTLHSAQMLLFSGWAVHMPMADIIYRVQTAEGLDVYTAEELPVMTA